MRMKGLAAVVMMSLCLVTTAWASNWTAGNGNWNLGGNWDAGVPNATDPYDVFVWYSGANPSGGQYDRDDAAEYDITHGGTTDTVILDQDVDMGQWVSLGSYAFTGTGVENVKVTSHATSQSPPVNSTSADAVRWTRGGNDVIVDNLDAGDFATTGVWSESGAADEYAGSSLWSGTAGSTATWTPTLTGASAAITNGGTATLDTGVPTISTLSVAWFSTLNIQGGANVTASGDASVAGGGNDFGTVAQSGGVVALNSNLTLGGGADDIAKWTMTSNADLLVGANLTVGGAGQGTFELGDTGILGVTGNTDIGASGGNGTMTISGGTATLADVNVSGGTFAVQGSAPTINVANYTQVASGSLDVALGNTGISTINASGNMALAGTINVSVAGGTPAGIYDIIVADGTRINGFDVVNRPVGTELRYAEEGGQSIARLYVNVPAPPPDPPAGSIDPSTYDNAVSVSFTHLSHGSTNILAPGDVAGVVQEPNWNNVDFWTNATNPEGHDEDPSPVIVDNAGNPTGVVVRTSAWDGREENTGAVPSSGPSSVMMRGRGPSPFNSSSDPHLYCGVEVSNVLDAIDATEYDLVIYIGSGMGWQDSGSYGNMIITDYFSENHANGSVPPPTILDQDGYATLYTNFTGTHDRPVFSEFGEGWVLSTGGVPGNYMLFEGLTLDRFVIQPQMINSASNFHAVSIPGFQILRRTQEPPPPVIPEPAGLGLVGIALLAMRRRRS